MSNIQCIEDVSTVNTVSQILILDTIGLSFSDSSDALGDALDKQYEREIQPLSRSCAQDEWTLIIDDSSLQLTAKARLGVAIGRDQIRRRQFRVRQP